MNFVSFLSASDTSISSAALYAVVGFVIVLAVLALLVGIFYATGYLFSKTRLGADNILAKKQSTEAKPTEAAVGDESDDGELIAVITAAISAVYESEAAAGDVKPEFVIRRVKRNK